MGLTGNMLELALRQVGLLYPRMGLPDELKRALEDMATILNIQLQEMPPENDASEASIAEWVRDASRLTRLRTYFLLFLNGMRIDHIEAEILREERKLKDRRLGIA